MLTKEQMLGLCELKTKEIDVPEFGGMIKIRELTLEDAARVYRETSEFPEGERGFQDIIRTVAAGVVDESNNPIFTVEQVSSLGKRYSKAVVDTYHAIGDLSGAASVEEQEKNSDPALIVNSSSS